MHWNPVAQQLPEAAGVLIADDVHLATPECLRRLTRWDTGVVAAHRPAQRDAEEILDAVDGAPLVLEPLTVERVRALLADSWGGDVDDDVAAQVHTATAGVARLVVAVAAAGPVARVTGSAALDELVRAERQRLTDAERDLLDAAAVLPGLDLSLLAAAAGLSVNAAANAAERLAAAGLTVDAGARLAPVLVDTLGPPVPASAVTAIVERAATAAVQLDHDIGSVAEHVRRTGVTGPSAAACLLAAAREVLDRDPARAHGWIEAAGHGGAPAGDLEALRALTGFRRGDVQATVRPSTPCCGPTPGGAPRTCAATPSRPAR